MKPKPRAEASSQARQSGKFPFWDLFMIIPIGIPKKIRKKRLVLMLLVSLIDSFETRSRTLFI